MSQANNPSRVELLVRIQEFAEGTEYSADAFVFTLQAINLYASPDLPRQHVDGEEVCWRFRECALSAFGPEAKQQLHNWGVHSTADIGAIVFALVAMGLAATSESDTIEDFQEVYDFNAEFPALNDSHITSGLRQWRLSTLFLITTVVAIAMAGAAKLGFGGAVGSLLSAWFALIGFISIFHGVTTRTRGWLFSFGLGVLFCAIGIGGFLAITMAAV